MPISKSLCLKHLCHKTMAENFDQLQDEIAQLPTKLIEDIYDDRNSLNFQFSAAPHEIFLHSDKREIELYFKTKPTKIPYDCNVVHRITSVCTNLRCLKITNVFSVSSADWINLFRAVTRIETVDVRSTSCCDSVLTTIGSNCPQLRDLNLSSCSNISDTGIRNLCTLGPQNMKIVKFDISDTWVTKEGCLVALQNLPFLKRFICRSRYLSDAAANVFRTLVSCDQTFATVEHIDCGEIGTINDWKALRKTFPSLSGLDLDGESEPIRFDSVAALVDSSPCRLTHLVLSDVASVDVAAIGRLFPDLRVLKLFRNGYDFEGGSCSGDYSDTFKCLVKLEVVDTDVEESPLPDFFLRMLLENCPRLQKLVVIWCDALNDRVFGDFVERNPLTELRELRLSNCDAIGVRSLLRILGVENPLGFVAVENCRKIGRRELRMMEEFVRDRAMYVEFSFTEYGDW